MLSQSIYCLHETPFIGEDKKYFYLYKIINTINGKIYIGAHSTDSLNDSYMGSGVALHKAFEKYGIENFRKEILMFFHNNQELYKKESEIVTESFVERKDTYNMTTGGYGAQSGKYNQFYGKHHTEETKEKIRSKAVGRTATEEARKNMSKARKGVIKSQKWKDAISKGKKEGYHPYRNKPQNEILKEAVSKQILVYDPISMDLLIEFPNVTSCLQYFNIADYRILKKIIIKNIIYKGKYLLQYKYPEKNIKVERKTICGKNHPNRKIIQKYDLEGNLLMEFNTVKECLFIDKLNHHILLDKIKKQISYRGYIYRYKEVTEGK